MCRPDRVCLTRSMASHNRLMPWVDNVLAASAMSSTAGSSAAAVLALELLGAPVT